MVHKVNKASVRFNEFSEVPKVFNLVDLSVSGISNGVFNDPKKVGSGYRLINVKDMYGTDCVDTDKLTLLNIENKEFNKNKVQYGDIFFTRSSIVPSGIAYSNVCLSNAEDITFDGHLMKLSPNLSLVEPSYLAYKLRTWTMRTRLIRRGKQSTMTTIGQSDIADIPLELPTIEEQKKIASFLSKVDEKIALLTEKAAKLKEYKKGVMQQLFDGKWQEQDGKLVFVPPTLRFKADDGSEFPDWETVTIEKVAKLGKGFTPSTHDPKNWNGGLPWLSIADLNQFNSTKLTSRTLSQEGADKKAIVKAGTLIMSFKLTLGRLIILQHDAYTNEAICHFNWVDGRVNTKFAFYYLSSINISSFGSQAAKGITLNNDSLYSIVLKLPFIDEQVQIANCLSAIDQKIELASSELEKVKEWKKGLLQQMFV